MKKNFEILAIDDEPVIIDSILKIGILENIRIDTAATVEEAIKKINTESFKLIISDLMLANMTGFDLIGELANRGIDIPIVITSGYSSLENAIKSLRLGAIEFLPKPFTFDELNSVIRRGLKYSEIIQISKKNHDELLYVPCPSNYYRFGYTSWIKVKSREEVVIGLTDLCLRTIKSLDEIILTENEEIEQGKDFIILKSGDEEEHKILSPISGTIIHLNNSLKENKNLLEKDPYFEGWIFTVKPTQLEKEIKNLRICVME